MLNTRGATFFFSYFGFIFPTWCTSVGQREEGTSGAAASSGCRGREVSKSDVQKSARLPSFLWHPFLHRWPCEEWLTGRLIMRLAARWLAGREREAHTTPDCCISQCVRPHTFWHQQIWTNITGIIKRCRGVNHHPKCLFGCWFFGFCPCLVASSLSISYLISLEAFFFELRWKTGTS